MPSQMLAIARSDDSYVAKLDSRGFSTNSTMEHEGTTYTHDEIAGILEESYRTHRPEFAIVCGGKPRVNRKRTRQLDKAVKADVYYRAFNLSWATVAMGALVLALTGPLGLLFSVVACYFEFLLSKDLSEDPQMMMAMGVA
jgi:hypothetical protein